MDNKYIRVYDAVSKKLKSMSPAEQDRYLSDMGLKFKKAGGSHTIKIVQPYHTHGVKPVSCGNVKRRQSVTGMMAAKHGIVYKARREGFELEEQEPER